MSMAISILQIIGWILLTLFLICVVLILAVLLIPIRYKGELHIEDPEPHDEPAWAAIAESARGRLICSWCGPLIRIVAAVPAEQTVDLCIAWMHVDVARMIRKETPHEPERGSGSSPQTMSIYDKIIGIYRKADYYLRVLRKEETGYTLGRLGEILQGILRRILPARWQIHGIVGLGDPAATARVLEMQGMLYPILAGHVTIDPVFLQYQMHVDGECQGDIRILQLVTAGIAAISDRRIRQTIRRFRNADRNIAAHYKESSKAAPES